MRSKLLAKRLYYMVNVSPLKPYSIAVTPLDHSNHPIQDFSGKRTFGWCDRCLFQHEKFWAAVKTM